MIWLRLFILRLCGLFLKRKMERDLEDEIHSHLDMQIEDNLRLGLSPDEARYEALRKFGGVEQVKESYRDRSSLSAVDSTLQDLRYALRTLQRSPGFAVVTVLTLALGIGANTAIFSLIDAILLRRLPVKQPEQLVLFRHADSRAVMTRFAYSAYRQFREQNEVCSGVLAYHPLRLTVRVENSTEPAVAGQLVSGNYYSVLGVNAALGRTIAPDDDRAPGESPVCVISYDYWQRRFAGDPAVVGKIIHLSGAPFTIIGVTQPGFFGLEVGSSLDISVPLMMQQQVMPGIESFVDTDNDRFTVMGRLRPGGSMPQAHASLSVLYQQIVAEYASRYGGVKRSRASWLEERLVLEPGGQGVSELRRQFSRSLWVLMTVVTLVLLVACANVAGLLLAKAVARRREIAIRMALGAARCRLIRQLLTESLLLSGLGGLLGLLFAAWGTRLLLPLLSQGEFPAQLNLNPDARMLGFTVAVSALTGVLFGLAPAFQATRVDLHAAIKQDAPGMSQRGARLSFGQVFVIFQVAISLLLLVGAGLFVRSLQKLNQVDAGFVRKNVLVLKLEPVGSDNKSRQLGTRYDELLNRVEALPGVRVASLVGYSPMSRREWLVMGDSVGNGSVMAVQGYFPQSGEDMKIHSMQVYPRSFAALGIPLVAGRDFNSEDVHAWIQGGGGCSGASAKVGIINESMARRFFGDKSPIGRRFGFAQPNGSCRTGDVTTVIGVPGEIEIIGVARDVKYTSLRNEGRAMFYLPFHQSNTRKGQMTLVVRTAGDPTSVAAAVQREARALDAQMPMYEVETLSTQVAASLHEERLLATLSGGFGLLALLVSCLGLYGLLSYAVTQRTKEIGVRMALGAARHDVLWLVFRDALRLVLLGVTLGLPAALAASRFVASQLFDVRPTDALTINAAILSMLAVAAVAGYLSARRATRVDPLVALRNE